MNNLKCDSVHPTFGKCNLPKDHKQPHYWTATAEDDPADQPKDPPPPPDTGG